MILKHNKDICTDKKSIIFNDNTFNSIIQRITPYSVYTQNKEFIDSFSTTLVNYSPISINIVDYWNKDIVDNSIFVPFKTSEIQMDVIHPFEFAESDPPVDENYGLGFKTIISGSKADIGGSLVDIKGNFDETPEVGLCPDETSERFWINSTIGLQDRLAETHLNNFYSALRDTTKDNIISHRIYKILKDLDLDTEGLFENTNVLFSEDAYLSNRHFNTKKGTSSAIKYASQGAINSQMQGKVPLSSDYYMDIREDSPFEYSVESNMLGVLFERFVKPLAHPIGMIYNYRTVCVSDIASQTESPLIEYDYSDTTIFVKCLCFVSGFEDDPMPPDPGDPNAPDIECIYGTYPEEKIFATPDGKGLWEPLMDDPASNTGNIPKSYEEGVTYDNSTPGISIPLTYNKWTFENENILVQFIKEPYTNNTSKTIVIEYYTYNSLTDDYYLKANFVNQRHCIVGVKGTPKRTSYVKEDIQKDCTDIHYGMFTFLDKGETTPPESPTLPPYGTGDMYDGFWVDLNDDQNPDEPPLGGVFDKFTDVYYGYFQFLDKKEEKDYIIGEWPVSGLTEGLSESMIYDQTLGLN